MSIKDQILRLIHTYQEREEGIYVEDDDGHEMNLLDDIEYIFNNHDVFEYNCDYEVAFENCGCAIYTVSVAWIEGGKLKTILNAIIESL